MYTIRYCSLWILISFILGLMIVINYLYNKLNWVASMLADIHRWKSTQNLRDTAKLLYLLNNLSIVTLYIWFCSANKEIFMINLSSLYPHPVFPLHPLYIFIFIIILLVIIMCWLCWRTIGRLLLQGTLCYSISYLTHSLNFP